MHWTLRGASERRIESDPEAGAPRRPLTAVRDRCGSNHASHGSQRLGVLRVERRWCGEASGLFLRTTRDTHCNGSVFIVDTAGRYSRGGHPPPRACRTERRAEIRGRGLRIFWSPEATVQPPDYVLGA